MSDRVEGARGAFADYVNKSQREGATPMETKLGSVLGGMITDVTRLREERNAWRGKSAKRDRQLREIREEREALKAEVERWKAAYHEQIEREPK